MTDTTNNDRQLTREQVSEMTPDEINDARHDGRLDDVMGRTVRPHRIH